MKAKKKFKTPLDKLCGKGRVTDQTHYIYFKGEFIYVTDGGVAIKQKMDLHEIEKSEQALLNGRAIHKDVFKLINRHKDVEFVQTLTLGTRCIQFKIDKSTFSCSMPQTKKILGGEKIVEQIDKAFSSFNMNPVNEIAINPEHINMLNKVFVTNSSGFIFRFNTNTGGVLITPNKSDYKEHAMIVPLMTIGEYAKNI